MIILVNALAQEIAIEIASWTENETLTGSRFAAQNSYNLLRFAAADWQHQMSKGDVDYDGSQAMYQPWINVHRALCFITVVMLRDFKRCRVASYNTKFYTRYDQR